MRLGVIGESLIERIIARTNLAPAPLMETQIAFSMARAIMAGVKLGIYDAIGTGAATAAEVGSDWNSVIMASETSVPSATARSWACVASPEAARKMKAAMMISIGLYKMPRTPKTMAKPWPIVAASSVARARYPCAWQAVPAIRGRHPWGRPEAC